MKLTQHISACIIACLFASSLHAQEQDKLEEIYMQAEQEADKMQRVLDLEYWQTFYVDSTLKHDYVAMYTESERLKESKVSSERLYMAVQDRWMDKIDETFKRIFTQEQWAAYLKGGAAKAQKARAKRKAQAEGK